MIKESRMVKLLFETILSHGAFHIGGYVASESDRARAMRCVVNASQPSTNVWNELDGKHAAVGIVRGWSLAPHRTHLVDQLVR